MQGLVDWNTGFAIPVWAGIGSDVLFWANATLFTSVWVRVECIGLDLGHAQRAEHQVAFGS